MADNIRHRRKPRNNPPETDPSSKKKNTFPTPAAFRGLGCTASASSQVSLPAVIRTSANWRPNKLKKESPNAKNKQPIDININNNNNSVSQSSLSSAFTSSSDVWCAPILSDSDGPVEDCVVSTTRPIRPKLDRIVLAQREHSYPERRMVIPEDNPFVESEAGLAITRIRSNVSGSRHHRHAHGFREGLAEIVMLQSSLLMGGRSNGLDRYRDLRLDVDNMSYEELLELGDRIGYVSTGLREDEITHCLRKTKRATLEDLLLHCDLGTDRKCSICQEEYEGDDETGKLNCGHFYHMYCIKQWLGQKNACPICKTAALSQT
ncbi:hypothetical protein CASFOL_015720 [Castilleja foliolosa]|uniref:RING-type E3 ubiquitin transferase n=1 Tax=Castilleja foliolosa TaxID=1961234 RepID=A0ABD3DFE7_9LAMI